MNGLTAQQQQQFLSTKLWDKQSFFNCNLMLYAMSGNAKVFCKDSPISHVSSHF